MTNETKVLILLNEAGKKGVTIQEVAESCEMTPAHARMVLSNLAKKKKAHSEPVRWKAGV